MPNQRDLIRSALEKLGPEKVERMLEAFRDDDAPYGGWHSCALARAYGAPGALQRAITEIVVVSFPDKQTHHYTVVRIAHVSRLLGLTDQEVNACVRAYDDALRNPLQRHPDEVTHLEMRYMCEDFVKAHEVAYA